jgi:hypothetical protein
LDWAAGRKHRFTRDIMLPKSRKSIPGNMPGHETGWGFIRTADPADQSTIVELSAVGRIGFFKYFVLGGPTWNIRTCGFEKTCHLQRESKSCGEGTNSGRHKFVVVGCSEQFKTKIIRSKPKGLSLLNGYSKVQKFQNGSRGRPVL